MVIGLLFAENGEGIKKSLLNVSDNLVIHTYDSIDKLIQETSAAHLLLDRIILTKKGIGGASKIESLDNLRAYTEDIKKSPEIIYMYKESEGASAIKSHYEKIFNIPTTIVAYMGDRPSVNDIHYLTQNKIEDIKKKFAPISVENKESGSKSENTNETAKKGGLFGKSKGSGSSGKNMDKSSQKDNVGDKESSEFFDRSSENSGLNSGGLSDSDMIIEDDPLSNIGDYSGVDTGFIDEDDVNDLSELDDVFRQKHEKENAPVVIGDGSIDEDLRGALASIKSAKSSNDNSQPEEQKAEYTSEDYSDEGYNNEDDIDELNEEVDSGEEVNNIEHDSDVSENVEFKNEENYDLDDDIIEPEYEDPDKIVSDDVHSSSEIIENDHEPESDDYNQVNNDVEQVDKKDLNKSKEENMGYEYTGVNIILGSYAVNNSQYVIDKAVELASKGKKILVIDADYKYNNILSYIDIKKFYSQGKDKGIANCSIYTEDKIDFLSNGYGVAVSGDDIFNYLKDKAVRDRYDVIFINCPVDCIDVLPYRLLRASKIELRIDFDYSDWVAVSMILTNRSKVSLESEKHLMKNMAVNFYKKPSSKRLKYIKADLNYVKSWLFFANGSWIERVAV